MCKKPTAVSHGSAESEVFSLDAGVSMDGIPALDLLGFGSGRIAFFFKPRPSTRRSVARQIQWETIQHNNEGTVQQVGKLGSTDLNYATPTEQLSLQNALPYILEDSDAVMKIIINVRSPTMRHVSRTHRFALDWLFARINLDPKINIMYVGTRNQLSDILTKERCHS